MRRTLLAVVCFLFMAGSSYGGWLEVLKEAGSNIGKRAVDDAATGAYEGAKATAKESLNKPKEGSSKRPASGRANEEGSASTEQDGSAYHGATADAAPAITITSPEFQRGVKLTASEPAVTVTGTATSESGVTEVKVNGQPAALGDDGSFSAQVNLKVGENKITVRALGANNKWASEQFTMVRPSSAAAGKPAQRALPVMAAGGENYALVIGINQYRHIEKLRTAVNDAQSVAKLLKDSYAFETHLLLDQKATHDAILKELNALRSRLKPSDRLLIYYAGHGILDNQTDASYWLPVDAEPNDDTYWLDTKRITDQLKRITARQVLVVADSCYSGTISRAVTVDLQGSDLRENYLKKLQEKPSRVLIASGGNEPVSDSGGKSHSIFAQALLDGLQRPERPIFTASELLTNRLRESVAGRAQQTPEYKVIRNSGHEGGDFIFEKRR